MAKVIGVTAAVLFSVGTCGPGGAADVGPAPAVNQQDDRDQPGNGKDVAPDQPAHAIVVTGSRIADSVKTYPGSVTVLDSKSIQTQLGSTNDIASILAKEVPGMAPASSGTSSNVDQSLRGRVPRIFIDGVEVSTPLRDGGRDIRSVSPQSLASIEVIRGASSLYGEGGGGGVINYVTRTGHPGEPWTFKTELGTSFSTTHFSDSLDPSIFQSAQGSIGNFDIDTNAYYERSHGFYDANGNRLQPDPLLAGGDAYSKTLNLFAKLGYTLGSQRIEAMVNYYDQTQSTSYQNIAGNVAAGIPTSTAKGTVSPRAADPKSMALISYLAYINPDIFGSSLRAQVYYGRDHDIFAYNPTRLGGTYTATTSRKYGFRSDVKTVIDAFGLHATLLWGADINRDRTVQPVFPAPSLNQQFGAPLEQTDYAGFAQLEVPLWNWLALRAGVRHDQFDVDVDPFVSGVTSARIGGGTLKYHATPVNAGATFQVARGLQLYGSYAQGFSVPDIGLALRGIAKPADNSVVQLNYYRPEAVVVTNYEVGIKYHRGPISSTLAVYQSTSPSGTDFQTIVVGSGTATDAYRNEVILLRGKERIRGIEGTLDIALSKTAHVGGNFFVIEGRRDSNGDGRIDSGDAYLSGRRIPPTTFTVYGDYDISPNWSVHLQGQHTGARNRFPLIAPGGSYYYGRVRPTFVADASTKINFGMITATIGMSNIFNKQYYPVSSQEYNQNNTYTPAEGRKMFIRLSANY